MKGKLRIGCLVGELKVRKGSPAACYICTQFTTAQIAYLGLGLSLYGVQQGIRGNAVRCRRQSRHMLIERYRKPTVLIHAQHSTQTATSRLHDTSPTRHGRKMTFLAADQS